MSGNDTADVAISSKNNEPPSSPVSRLDQQEESDASVLGQGDNDNPSPDDGDGDVDSKEPSEGEGVAAPPPTDPPKDPVYGNEQYRKFVEWKKRRHGEVAIGTHVAKKARKPLISTTTRTTSPHNNDVLFGRGKGIYTHPGNEQYRRFVERKKPDYVAAQSKCDKRLVASKIVVEIRNLEPPGRFLMNDPDSGMWYDVGYQKARNKTSQALRENNKSHLRDGNDQEGWV